MSMSNPLLLLPILLINQPINLCLFDMTEDIYIYIYVCVCVLSADMAKIFIINILKIFFEIRNIYVNISWFSKKLD